MCPSSLGFTNAYRLGAGAAIAGDGVWILADDALLLTPADAPSAVVAAAFRRFSSAALRAASSSDSWMARASAASLMAANASRWAWMKAASLAESNMATE